MPPKKSAKKQPARKAKKAKTPPSERTLTAAQWKLLKQQEPIGEASRRHGRTPTLGMLTEEKRYQVVNEYFADTGKKFKGLPLKGSIRRIALFHGCDPKTVRQEVIDAEGGTQKPTGDGLIRQILVVNDVVFVKSNSMHHGKSFPST
jgi:hypothetical protein